MTFIERILPFICRDQENQEKIDFLFSCINRIERSLIVYTQGSRIEIYLPFIKRRVPFIFRNQEHQEKIDVYREKIALYREKIALYSQGLRKSREGCLLFSGINRIERSLIVYIQGLLELRDVYLLSREYCLLYSGIKKIKRRLPFIFRHR